MNIKHLLGSDIVVAILFVVALVVVSLWLSIKPTKQRK
jgi:hypothetical protein